VRDSLVLFLLSIIAGFTVFQYGGVAAAPWNLTLVALCILSLFAWLPGRSRSSVPPLSRAFSILIIAVLVYVAFQLLPLPAGWLSVLSPARFQILQALARVQPSRWAPLSVSPQLTFAHLLRLLAYLLVFFLARELSFRLANRVWLLALPLLVIASVESSIGLVQHFETGGYATGTYANHGHLAGLLEMVLPLTLALILTASGDTNREARGSTTTAARVCLLLACGALILLGLLYTSSRMGLAAAATAFAVMGVLSVGSGRKRSMVALLAAAAALTFLLLSAPLSLISRYESGLTSEVRLQIWHDTLKLIANYPVFGCGLGTFVSAIQEYRASTPIALVDFAHSDYLQLLAELGVVGSLLLMALAALIVRDIFTAARAGPSQAAHLIAMACAASIVAIAVHSLVDFQFYIPANVMIAAWIAGIAGGIRAHTTQLQTSRRSNK
jgi:O-antigen ligase